MIFRYLFLLAGGLLITCWAVASRADDGPEPIFEKPVPLTWAELAKTPLRGVQAVEVSDYAPGRYRGPLKPAPPHADLNPGKAVVIVWEKFKHRFVFSHEASYCPWIELPGGTGLCNQFFEGNAGWGELFNSMGRKERNSFVDVIQSGPQRAWVRWNLLRQIAQSKGFALVMPFKEGMLFVVLGQASGFPSAKSQIVDHSFRETGGWGWGAQRWDHWPVGWLNSQGHDMQPGSPYPYSFGPFSHYIVTRPIERAGRDFPVQCRDMEHNRWTERHVYYTLVGAAADLETVRRLARSWFDKGAACARPDSIADLLR